VRPADVVRTAFDRNDLEIGDQLLVAQAPSRSRARMTVRARPFVIDSPVFECDVATPIVGEHVVGVRDSESFGVDVNLDPRGLTAVVTDGKFVGVEAG
jgi:hypothetical protein